MGLVRNRQQPPAAWWADVVLLLLGAGLLGGLLLLARRAAAPASERVVIDLSWWALPKYAVLSLTRGFAAYGLSLLFSLVYGTLAAHHRRAERLMIPALDVLQSIPVLGFLPGLVLAMLAVSPSRQVGLELACIVMIFTGQVWNMTFSYYDSVRTIPQSLREVAVLQNFSRWQTFRLLELPAAMIGLVWNSMMSMAGGWFFLMVNEAFTLGGRDYRLPGIGAYMHEAVQRGEMVAVLGAIGTMVLLIVGVDQICWRPLVVWSQRFKLEDVAGTAPPRAWALEVLGRSRLGQVWAAWYRSPQRRVARLASTRPPSATLAVLRRLAERVSWAGGLLGRWGGMALLACGLGWGAGGLLHLLVQVPLYDGSRREDWLAVLAALGASFLRTSAAVLLGAAWTLPVGIPIGLSSRWSPRLTPVIQVLASFPAPMLFPLATLLLSALRIPFDAGCVLLLLLGSQWYILFNVIAGASAIPEDLKEVAAACGLRGLQRWRRLYLPAVFPHLVTGMLTAAGGAWNATIVAEHVELPHRVVSAFGLGATIQRATADGHFPLLAASVTTMALTVVLVNRGFWKRLYRLAEARYSLQL